MKLELVTNPEALAQRGAEIILDGTRLAVSQGKKFTIALSGGSTPKRLYELLSNPAREFRSQLPWSEMHFFWTDERHVGPEDPESNFRMTNEAMLGQVNIPAANIHRIPAELENAQTVAAEYEKVLLEHFGALPRFDFVLLGLGNDGHTASLFPGTEVLREQERLVAAPWVEKLNTFRFTMTFPVLNNAANVVFLVSGDEKAEIVKEVLAGEPGHYPAQGIKPTRGELIWLIDQAAASKLT